MSVESSKRWKLRNKEYVKEYWRRYRASAHGKATRRASYIRCRGISEPTRPRPKACEACGRKPGTRGLHCDHVHSTGKFRGWLCSQCNVALGMVGDTKRGLLKLIRYLEKVNANRVSK
jgi:Recombination endonuclease VII